MPLLQVMFLYSTMAAVAFFGAPLIAALLEMFVKDLRIEDLVSWLRRNTQRVRLGYIHHIYICYTGFDI